MITFKAIHIFIFIIDIISSGGASSFYGGGAEDNSVQYMGELVRGHTKKTQQTLLIIK